MFSEKLKNLRMAKGNTQSDVARAIGVTPATIGNYEQGTRIPKNKALLQRLAAYYNVSTSYLLDKTTSFQESPITLSAYINDLPSSFRQDVQIKYNKVDITSLIFQNPNEKNDVSREQLLAHMEFDIRSSHAIFARKNLLKILSKIESTSIEDIDYNAVAQKVNHDVIFWYKKCWNNIENLFPEVTDSDALYDLLHNCLCIDNIAANEFSLVRIDHLIDWLRSKFH